MMRNPTEAFFKMLQGYEICDPYTLQICLSYCSLICEKLGETGAKSIIDSGVAEFIENIKCKFNENQVFVQMVDSLLDTYIYCRSGEEFEI